MTDSTTAASEDIPARKSSYDFEDLLTCGRGEMFGAQNGRLPKPPMLMTDRVTQIAAATKDQTASSETIHETLKAFSEFTNETDQRAEALREIVSKLSDRSRQLEKEIGRFVTE